MTLKRVNEICSAWASALLLPFRSGDCVVGWLVGLGALHYFGVFSVASVSTDAIRDKDKPQRKLVASVMLMKLFCTWLYNNERCLT